MKYICKTVESEYFRSWISRNKGANWNDFSKTSEHRKLREHLIEDPTYLKAVIKENLKEEKTWPFGFHTVLVYLAETYDIPI